MNDLNEPDKLNELDKRIQNTPIAARITICVLFIISGVILLGCSVWLWNNHVFPIFGQRQATIVDAFFVYVLYYVFKTTTIIVDSIKLLTDRIL